MSEMIERVARALFLSEHPGSEWSAGRARAKWFCLAEAAIAAMREPTEAMVREGQSVPVFAVGQTDAIWEAMIDAALTTPEAPDA